MSSMAAPMEIDSISPQPEPVATKDDRSPNGGGDDDDDADPVVASYDVYTNAPLPENRKLLVLQHPNRQGPVRAPYGQLNEVRIKNKTGMIEVDVPLAHAHADYDRDKGLRWGSALSRSLASRNGGSLGLAGGFGVGVFPMRGGAGGGAGAGRGRTDDWDQEIGMLDWSEAVRQDKVLRVQTLGGQFPIETETNCRWMVGVFKGDQLHLTPATSIINLRPQLHHLDAHTEQERLSRPREGIIGAGGAAPAGKDSGGAGGSTGTARAIHMSIKSANTDSGELTVDTMSSRLRQVQLEPWMKLKYEDDESSKSWNMFTNNLLYAHARGVRGSGLDKGKGKEKAGTGAAADDDDGQQAFQAYKAQWTETEFLHAVSGSRDDQQSLQDSRDKGLKAKADEVEPPQSEPGRGIGAVRAKAARASTNATASPSRKHTRGKSVAFKE
ncbi:hypothetical protein GGS23DRAFT_274210 [Durotheca rogersii]|uniref:uncharacterized protein n=1 Tax=Durotheca rogersii TaxID=419775 RepID=UPI00222055AF|nr:uncharacterized protein GGS23DRAFT_274210 [Durotheca rogersii]KAI5866494.1 hypothetical protein GGS23DRAFT_274210 [Durotheca rogersii]